MKKHMITLVSILLILSVDAQMLCNRSRLGCSASQRPTLTQADFETVVQKAKAHDPESLYTMAQVFARGELVPLDVKSAYAYLKESADAGFGKAMIAIGLLEEYGGVPWREYRDFVNEYMWMDTMSPEIRFDIGNSNDVSRVAALYAKAKARGVEFAEVVRTNLLAKAEAHYAKEQKRIAEEEQRKRNAEMVRKALEAENPERQAQRRLRETGSSAKITVSNMLPLADALKDAERGDVEAMYSLAIRYLSGTDVERNVGATRKFLTGAAEKGHGGAQYLLGVLCEHELEDPSTSAFFNNQSEKRLFEYTKAKSVSFISPFGEEKYLDGLLNSNIVYKMLGYYAAAASNAVPEAVQALSESKQMVERMNAKLSQKKANAEKLKAYLVATQTNSVPIGQGPLSLRERRLRRNKLLQDSSPKDEKKSDVKDAEKKSVPKDAAECAEFYLSVSNHLAAAEAGSADDQFWMAKFCLAYSIALPDKRIDEKYEKAVQSLKWLTRAADAGQTNSMHSLGIMLIDGGRKYATDLHSVQLGLDDSYHARNLGVRLLNQTSAGDKPIVLKPYQMTRSTFSPDFVYRRDVKVTTNATGVVMQRARSTIYRRLYKQDVARGIGYLKKSAQSGYPLAKHWFELRSKYGLPEDLPTWACATNTLSLPAVGQKFKMTVKSRPYGDDETDRGFYRNITIDSTGKMVEVSAEFCTDSYDGPWHKPAHDVIIEDSCLD